MYYDILIIIIIFKILKYYKRGMETTYLYDDIWYNILIQSDIETIENLCVTNKNAYKICNNKSFWRNKFHNDGLPFDSQKQYNTVNEWIKEYNDTFIETLIVTFIDKVMLETNPGQSRKIYQNYIYSPQYISPELL